MVRLTFELTELERQRLATLSQRTGKPESTLIREALQPHLEALQPHKVDEDGFRAAFGLWKELGINSLEYQRQIRTEWDEGREAA
jgi:hypothetical protein